MDRKTRKKIFFFAKLVLAAGLIVAAYFLNRSEIDDVLSRQPKWSYFAAGFGLSFLIILVGVIRWRMLLSTQGADVRFMQVVRLNFIGYFFNMFIPGATGGDVVKAYYIATIFPDKKAQVVTTVFLDRFIGLYGLFCVAAVSIPFEFDALWSLTETRILVILVYALILGGFAFGALAFSRKVRESKRLRDLAVRIPFGLTLGRIYLAVAAYRDKPGQVLLAVLLSMLAHGINILGNYFYILALGVDVPLGTFFFAVPLALFINAIPIAPMGLGVGEMAYPFMFKLAGLSKVQQGASSVVAALMHLGFMSWSLFGTIFYIQGKDRIAHAVAAVEKDAEEEYRDPAPPSSS